MHSALIRAACDIWSNGTVGSLDDLMLIQALFLLNAFICYTEIRSSRNTTLTYDLYIITVRSKPIIRIMY